MLRTSKIYCKFPNFYQGATLLIISFKFLFSLYSNIYTQMYNKMQIKIDWKETIIAVVKLDVDNLTAVHQMLLIIISMLYIFHIKNCLLLIKNIKSQMGILSKFLPNDSLQEVLI